MIIYKFDLRKTIVQIDMFQLGRSLVINQSQ